MLDIPTKPGKRPNNTFFHNKTAFMPGMKNKKEVPTKILR